MKDRRRYCYLEPTFPIRAHVVAALVSQGDTTSLLPFPLITERLGKSDPLFTLVYEYVSHLQEEVHVLPLCLCVPIVLSRSISLKKEYWQNPSEHFNVQSHVLELRKLFYQPQFYSLLVTPSEYEEGGQWQFRPALALKTTNTDFQIEQFMVHSMFPVDHRAKSAALYTAQAAVVFDMNTENINEYVPYRSHMMRIH